MKKIILSLTICILLSPMFAHASIESEYKKELESLISLLMQKVEMLVLELNELQASSGVEFIDNSVEEILQEEKVENKPYFRPNYNYIPASPKSDRCHSGAIDIKVGDKDCK